MLRMVGHPADWLPWGMVPGGSETRRRQMDVVATNLNASRNVLVNGAALGERSPCMDYVEASN